MFYFKSTLTLEILNIELETIREEKIKGAQIRARSLELNEGENLVHISCHLKKPTT